MTMIERNLHAHFDGYYSSPCNTNWGPKRRELPKEILQTWVCRMPSPRCDGVPGRCHRTPGAHSRQEARSPQPNPTSRLSGLTQRAAAAQSRGYSLSSAEHSCRYCRYCRYRQRYPAAHTTKQPRGPPAPPGPAPPPLRGLTRARRRRGPGWPAWPRGPRCPPPPSRRPSSGCP